MITRHDLSKLDWRLSGWTPHKWRLAQSLEIGASPTVEVPSIPAKVPGSVQYALREAGIIPDWNIGLNYRECEWVENRHWIYETVIPDDWIEPGKTCRLRCAGLDYCGCVVVNGKVAGEFKGSHVPHVFDITESLREKDNVLRIVFELAPRWLGQFGFTSQMTEWKVRYNYTWDWTPRLVQTGITDAVTLEFTDGACISDFRCYTCAEAPNSTGAVEIAGRAGAVEGSVVRVSLFDGDIAVREEEIPAARFNQGPVFWSGLNVKLWYPNLEGGQPLYTLTCALIDADGTQLDKVSRRVGFRQVEWEPCEGAVPEADPWICVVNGRRVFLQGVNWTPLLPNFADATEEDYRRRLELYRDLGCNILRVWGGASLERECFYDMCDELGLMVWQEFPLSSSGVDNWPPEDETAIDEMAQIAESYIARRQHHPSLIIWCGGNELQGSPDGGKVGCGKPCDTSHPMLARLERVCREHDPTRRFLPTSSSGPRFGADPRDYGKGLHWDVHGPWKPDGRLEDGWTRYWSGDDSLMRSETGSCSASPAHIIRESAGDCDVMPATADNPLWRRTSTWWIEWHEFINEMGREPNSLEEYVEWSQRRQADALVIAAKSCKDRFPRCGGIIIWMGHDCFPCTANTAIIDFHGNPKPAALALKEIWRTPPPEKRQPGE